MEINSRFNANQNNVSPSVRKSDEFVKQENTSENKRILETKQPIDLQPEKTLEQTKMPLKLSIKFLSLPILSSKYTTIQVNTLLKLSMIRPRKY